MKDPTVSELVPLLLEFTERFAIKAWKLVLTLVENETGREIIGSVEDRKETEDVYVEADKLLEKLFQKECEEFLEPQGIFVHITSEHDHGGYGDENANVRCDIDPLDGTDQLINGILEAIASVFSFKTRDGEVLVGGTVDLIAGMLYLSDAVNKKTWRISLRTEKRIEVFPAQETELSGKSVVASYKGRWGYLNSWFRMVDAYFSREQFAGITHYSWGGSFIYAWLAAGIASVYIMMEEPTDEIRPGRAHVKAAKLCLYSVTEGGIIRLFRWSQKKRVKFFIAAPNELLARSIIDGIWKRDEEGIAQVGMRKARLQRLLSRPRIRRVNGVR